MKAGNRKPMGSSPVGTSDDAKKHERRWSWESLRHDLAVGLISGLAVAVLSLAGAVYFDDKRSDREELLEDFRSAREARQENLRFVRDRSSSQSVDRPFQDIDLGGQNLNGLNLAGADFNGASLINASMTGIDLTNSTLQGANLSGADLGRADLRGAFLAGANLKGAHLISTNLRGADLSGAILDGAIVTGPDVRRTVCHDATTIWPEGFVPPPIPVERFCIFPIPGEDP